MSSRTSQTTTLAALHYVDDAGPGLSRRRCGRGFTYLDPDGRAVRDPATVARLRSLAVPPAWTDVWFCADERGHIQATGRDAKGRKQYRYHDEWRQLRDEAKYETLADFGRGLGPLRQRVLEDMGARTLTVQRVVATTVWLLDHTLIRVGNDEYARDGSSYGLTTLLDEHVEVRAGTMVFRFVGKSGREHDVVLNDRRVARIVARCQDLPGQHLFQYLDNGEPRPVNSRDVNEYLREVMAGDFTAKTFRTWGGSVHTLRHLAAQEPAESATARRRQISDAIRRTAVELRNTPAVCRRCYVHPRILESHLDGALDNSSDRQGSRPSKAIHELLTPEEEDLMALLTRRS